MEAGMTKYLSVNQLAVRWGISPSTIYMCRGGTDRLRRVRFGKLVKFLLSEVEAVEAERIRAAKKVA
jgi:predicted DNA-binding transcriptional regulator AlpA